MDDDFNPYKSPEPTESTSPAFDPVTGLRTHRSDKLRIMAWMLVLYVLTACISFGADDDHSSNRAITLVSGLLFGMLCVRWCHYDGLERESQGWRYLTAMMVLCPGPLLAFPFYFFRTRGFSQGLLASLIAFGFLLILLAAYILTFFVMGFFLA